MSRTKWHGHRQKKAQRELREWVDSLSDADAKRMNIKKRKVYTQDNTTPEQKRYLIRKYMSDFTAENNICKAFRIELQEGYDFAETITPNGTRGITIKKVK